MNRSAPLAAGLAACLFSVLLALPAGAQEGEAETGDWPRVKCDRYRQATTHALQRLTTRGLGPEFLARHEAFLASGCTTPADVCPRSAEELAFANAMVILGMNAGMASTFMPFACRKAP